jgi:ATP-dependent Clp protease adapter protein ClpS
MFARSIYSFILISGCVVTLASSFSIPSRKGNIRHILTPSPATVATSTQLWMAEQEKNRSTKKGVSTIIKDKEETETEDEEIKEEMWRVVLHNDEVHTFNYVIRSLSKVVGTLDKKASFEICVETHGVGKATVTKTWKKQAEQFCLGLQRQGLTVSISPDKDFDGGHAGGGL